MKKKDENLAGRKYSWLRKTLKIMKLTFCIVLFSTMLVSAESYSQGTKLNLDYQGISISQLFEIIEKQSDYRFAYSQSSLDPQEKVSIDVKNENLNEVLEKVLDQNKLSYTIIDRYVIIANRNSIDNAGVVVQQISVTGKVTDSSGEPLPGATVVVKGTNTGTVTDIDGNYSLTSVPGDAFLEFSFIGMETQTVAIGASDVINVVMKEASFGVGEVVAIGYGVIKKSDLTGAISSVSSSDFEHQPIRRISSALQGRAAGVSITNLSGAPGGATRIRIRGSNSINGGNNPLYVVDGMQLASFNLNDLNPTDVENIEILKDASATAIYGSRGANGVVLVTTKKGKTEKAKVDFETRFGISQLSYKYDLLDPVSYANQVNMVSPNAYSAEYIAQLKDGAGTDWQDAIFQTGKTQEYLLSISAATPKFSYYISGRYQDQTGIVINTNFKRYSFSANVESKISDKVTVSASTLLNRGEGFNNQNTGSLRGGVNQAIMYGPAELLQEADGTYGGDPWGALGPNPVGNLLFAFQKNISNAVLLNTKVSYKIFDFLTLDILAGMDANLSEFDNLNIPPYAPYGVLSAGRRHNSSMGLQNSNILTFHKEMGNHNLTVTGVLETSKGSYDFTSASGSGSTFTQSLQYYALGTMIDKAIGSGYGMSKLLSYVGRVNYSFSNKYLITASYRADGSSKFPNNRWGYFPSAALGWRASEEVFIKDIDLFSNLKFRGSWGVTGNQGVPAFATIPKMRTGNYAYGTGSGTYSEISNSIGDPNLKWEQTSQTDVGFDMGFFENRLNISADYFNKQTKDLLFSIPIPIYWGGGNKQANVGSVENKGFELSLSGIPIDTKDLNWTVSFNYSSYKNKVLELGGGATFMNSNIEPVTGNGIVQNDFLRNIVGESMGTFWGNQFLGIYQESEAAEAAKYNLNPGDSKYLDLNGDYKIDGNDKLIIGHAMPKFTWGLNNTVIYKNFELNLFIMGVHGNDIFNSDYAHAAARIADSRTITSADAVSWTPENKSNMWPKLTSSSNKEIVASSKWIQDGSFVRVKNLSLSYRIPSSIIKGVPFKLGVSGQNLFTFTKFKGFDPEAASGGENDINQGLVLGAYPSAREVTFSLQINF